MNNGDKSMVLAIDSDHDVEVMCNLTVVLLFIYLCWHERTVPIEIQPEWL